MSVQQFITSHPHAWGGGGGAVKYDIVHMHDQTFLKHDPYIQISAVFANENVTPRRSIILIKVTLYDEHDPTKRRILDSLI